jgi:hypothetical protein
MNYTTFITPFVLVDKQFIKRNKLKLIDKYINLVYDK